MPPRSPAPSTYCFCSSIVEMTGSCASGSNSVDPAPAMPGDVAGVLDDHALQAQAQPERRDAVGAGVGERAELALEAADAEAAGDADRVDVVQVLVGALVGLALVGGDPADLDLGLVGEAAGAQRLADREVGVRQVDVLADQRDGHLLLRVVDAAEQVVPGRPVDVAERQVEAAYDVGVEALAVQHLGDVVDRRRVGGGDHGLVVDVAHQRDLALDAVRELPVRAADDGVGLDADGAQRGDRVLGRLGLQLARRADVGHQGDVDEEAVLPADLVAGLAGGLEEGQRLDVADGAADLGDDDVDVVAAHGQDAVLDLVGDVRDHLDGVAEVVAAALLGDDRRVDLAGRHVGDLVEVGVEESLVVPDVEVRLRTVVGHEDLAVLERVHRPRVDVEVGVELLHGHAETASLQKGSEAGGGEPLAERGGDASGHEYVLGRRPVLHGVRAYPSGTGPSAPDAPNDPPGVSIARASAITVVTWPAVVSTPSTVATSAETGLGAQASELALATVRGVAHDDDAGRGAGQTGDESGQDRVAALGGRLLTEDQQHERRPALDVGGRGHEVGAGEALEDRAALAVGGLALRRGGRHRQPQELADPVVGGRLGGDRVALLGHQLAAEGVDERLLVGSDHRLGEVVARRHRSPGGGDPLGEPGDHLLVRTGDRHQGDLAVGQPAGDEGGGHGAREALGVRRLRGGLRDRGARLRRGGLGHVGEQPAAEDDAHGEGRRTRRRGW